MRGHQKSCSCPRQRTHIQDVDEEGACKEMQKQTREHASPEKKFFKREPCLFHPALRISDSMCCDHFRDEEMITPRCLVEERRGIDVLWSDREGEQRG